MVGSHCSASTTLTHEEPKREFRTTHSAVKFLRLVNETPLEMLGCDCIGSHLVATLSHGRLKHYTQACGGEKTVLPAYGDLLKATLSEAGAQIYGNSHY
jgi:hypothetical protein